MINIGIRQTANLLNTISIKYINFSFPKIQIVTLDEYMEVLSNTSSL